MMQKIKKPVSILLSILMVLSLFTVVPIASASAESGTIYDSGEHEVSELNAGDYIVGGVESVVDSAYEYTITLKAGTYTDWPAGEIAYDEDFTADSGMFEVGTTDGILYFDDWTNGYSFMPFVDDAAGNAFYVESADHDAKTITLAGANAPAPTEAPTEASGEADRTFSEDATFENGLAVDTEVWEIAEDVTVTVNGGLVITGELTVEGKGTLIVNGADGANGRDGDTGASDGAPGGDGDNGEVGGAAVTGSIKIDGVTVRATGGNGGDGGSGGDGAKGARGADGYGDPAQDGGDGGDGGHGGNGGNGGYAFAGTVTILSGEVFGIGGTGGAAGYYGDGGAGGDGGAFYMWMIDDWEYMDNALPGNTGIPGAPGSAGENGMAFADAPVVEVAHTVQGGSTQMDIKDVQDPTAYRYVMIVTATDEPATEEPTEAPTPAKPQAGDVLPESDYLTFTAVEAGSSVTLNAASGGNLQYNKNNSGWVSYNEGTEIALENEGDSVSFSGKDITFSSGNHITIDGKVACSGNVMSLRLSDGVIQGLSEECFYCMFDGCDGLTTAPELPETALAPNCYGNMFEGCTSLTAAPELPATTLANGCYSGMFAGCESLSAAPELPATTLESECYYSMFAGCEKLTTAPELPAKALAYNCYNCMFEGCTSLTAAPELPATTLEGNCYNSMFMGCQSLSELPELPATTLASMCYYNMFSYCPKIYISDEAGTFDGITYSVEYRIPSSGTAESAMYALNDMFGYTGGKFKGTPNLNTTYYVPAPELPDVIKDCTYQYSDTENVYANVPFIIGENYSEFPNGAILTDTDPDDNQRIVVYDAKGYSYHFYDKTGTEIPVTLSGTSLIAGPDVGLSDDVTIYMKAFDPTYPEGFDPSINEIYIVATVPELPEVIKDCTYTLIYSDFVLHANVPLTADIEDMSALPSGSICAPEAAGGVVLFDAKGYTYKFYDITGAEIPLTLHSSTSMPGSEVGLSEDVTVYHPTYTGVPETCSDVYVVATEPTEAPTEEPTDAPSYEAGYYVVGTFTEEEWTIDPAYRLSVNLYDDGEFMLGDLTFSENDSLKVIYAAPGEEMIWYPEGMDNNYIVTADGTYTIYFRPNYDGGDDWYYNVIYLASATEPATEEPTEPVEETITLNSGTDKLSNHGIQNLQKGNHLDFEGNGLPWGTFVAPAGKVFTKIVTSGTTAGTMNWTGSAERVDHDNMRGEWYIDFDTDEDGFRPFTISFTLADAPTGYTVTWKNGDTVLETDENVAQGTTPEYNGTTPEKAEDDSYTYTFAGWNDGAATYGATDTLPAVTGDITYTATFDAVAKYEEGYYLIGTFTNWKVDPAYRLTANPEADGEYMITQVSLTATDGFKVVYAKPGENYVWYPDGVGNDISVENNDKYNIYFCPEGKDDEAWDYGMIFTERYVPAESTEVINAINALPVADDVTLADAEQINAARDAYDALTDEQKDYIDTDTLKKLTDAEAALAAAIDQDAADAVDDMIDTLPAEITLADKTAVEAARQAYDNLTDAQKNLIDPETLETLTDAEDAIAALEVTALIEALPAEITLADKTDVEAAREAYDALTDDQKDLVDDETLAVLTDAEAAIADLEAAADVEARINALPAEITLADKTDVEAAREAYEALTDAQKDLVDDDTLAVLTDAEAAIADLEAAAAVEALIEALPAEITLADKTAVEAAREAYEALTDAQKDLIDDDTLAVLTDAEAAIADLEAAADVEALIDALPELITVDDKDAVEGARAAYDALTDDQKALVDDLTVAELLFAENELAVAQDIAAAEAVEDQINALPAITNITINDKDAIDEAAAAYDALTDDQKGYVSLSSKLKLTTAELALAAIEKNAADEAAADEVEALIEALPAAADVTPDDAQAIEEAQAAYDALTRDQKLLVNLGNRLKLAAVVDKLQTEIDRAAGDEVEAMIEALPAPAEVTLDDAQAIEEAQAAYDALTDNQKTFVATIDRIKFAAVKGALAALVDEAAADEVEALIEALPDAADVTPDDAEAIEEAVAAYNALTRDQKLLIPLTDRTKLTAVEAALNAEIDQAAADEVTELIEALPAADDVTLDDAQAIEEAQAAYDALTDAQKARVPMDDRLKLAAVNGALSAAVDEAAADAVEELIEALPAPGEITLEDKEAVEEARAAYDALTRDQKLRVLLTDRLKLVNDEAAIRKIENDMAAAEAVEELIDALPAAEDVVLEDTYDILAAKAAYNALTEDQKAYVDEDAAQKLDDAYNALTDKVNAKVVEDIINALPDAEDVTLRDKNAIDAARAAYEALNDDQKALVDEEVLQKLTDAEAALAPILDDVAAAQEVSDQIKALPDAASVTTADKEAIEAAAAAYDALTDEQKNYVPVADKAKLAAAKGALDAAEKFAADEAAADAVEELIEALPAPGEITIEDKEAVEEARAAYDALTRDQKLLVPLTDRVKLAADEAQIKAIEDSIAAVEAVKEQIEALPAAEDVTLDDGAAIISATNAYNNLTDAEKAQITDEEVQKLNDVQDAYVDHLIAEPVAALINILPEADEVTAEDAPIIGFVSALYDSLTDDQKAIIDDDTVKKLTDAEDALAKIIADQKAADDVKALIDALPAAADVTSDDQADVEAARAAYDALTDDQKALIDDATVKKLTDAEEKLNKTALLGDADGDGKVDVFDASAIQKSLAGTSGFVDYSTLTAEDLQFKIADVDADGKVDVFDVSLIQRWLAGDAKAQTYGIGEPIA